MEADLKRFDVLPAEFLRPVNVEDQPDGLFKLTFADGFQCYAAQGIVEAAWIYNELIVKQEYFQHGFSPAGEQSEKSCVIDVGANIGIFSMAARRIAPQATIYAFEPMPVTFQVLECNASLAGEEGMHLFNCAVGLPDQSERMFNFFPIMPGNSTVHMELKEAQKAITDVLWGKEISDIANLNQPCAAQVRALSAVIREQGITSVDFLKIDTEGGELEVMDSIEEEHWPMFRQVVVETHSLQLREEVCQRLEARGFQVISDAGAAAEVGDSLVFARRVG